MTGISNFHPSPSEIPSSNKIDKGINSFKPSLLDKVLKLLKLPLPREHAQKRELLQSIKNNFKNLPFESQMELQVFLGEYYTEEQYTQTDSEIGKVLSSLFQEHLQVTEKDFRSLTEDHLNKIWLGMLTTIEKNYAEGSEKFKAMEDAAHKKYEETIMEKKITKKSQRI